MDAVVRALDITTLARDFGLPDNGLSECSEWRKRDEENGNFSKHSARLTTSRGKMHDIFRSPRNYFGGGSAALIRACGSEKLRGQILIDLLPSMRDRDNVA